MMKPYRMIAALVAALLILAAAGCGASVGTATSATSASTASTTSAPNAPQTTVTADEYDVYSALIQSVYIDPIQPKQIVISSVDTRQPTSFGEAAPAIKSFWPDLGMTSWVISKPRIGRPQHWSAHSRSACRTRS